MEVQSRKRGPVYYILHLLLTKPHDDKGTQRIILISNKVIALLTHSIHWTKQIFLLAWQLSLSSPQRPKSTRGLQHLPWSPEAGWLQLDSLMQWISFPGQLFTRDVNPTCPLGWRCHPWPVLAKGSECWLKAVSASLALGTLGMFPGATPRPHHPLGHCLQLLLCLDNARSFHLGGKGTNNENTNEWPANRNYLRLLPKRWWWRGYRLWNRKSKSNFLRFFNWFIVPNHYFIIGVVPSLSWVEQPIHISLSDSMISCHIMFCSFCCWRCFLTVTEMEEKKYDQNQKKTFVFKSQ